MAVPREGSVGRLPSCVGAMLSRSSHGLGTGAVLMGYDTAMGLTEFATILRQWTTSREVGGKMNASPGKPGERTEMGDGLAGAEARLRNSLFDGLFCGPFAGFSLAPVLATGGAACLEPAALSGKPVAWAELPTGGRKWARIVIR